MSYADVAAKGQEVAESIASTASLVEIPPVNETQTERIEREARRLEKAAVAEIGHLEKTAAAEVSAARAAAASAASKARAAGQKTAAVAAEDLRVADAWITKQFVTLQTEHPGALQAALATNAAAVVGLAAVLGLRAWKLVERSQLSGKAVAAGLGILSAIAVVEGTLASYFYKTKKQ